MRHVFAHEVFILQTDKMCCPFRKGVGMDLEECGLFFNQGRSSFFQAYNLSI